jgi:hypothetical protein
LPTPRIQHLLHGKPKQLHVACLPLGACLPPAKIVNTPTTFYNLRQTTSWISANRSTHLMVVRP